jgi:hypothetical protein
MKNLVFSQIATRVTAWLTENELGPSKTFVCAGTVLFPDHVPCRNVAVVTDTVVTPPKQHVTSYEVLLSISTNEAK